MGSKGIEQGDEGPELITGDCARIVNLVKKCHKSGNSRVVFEGFNIGRNLLDCSVEGGFELLGVALTVYEKGLEIPDSVDESLTALYAVL